MHRSSRPASCIAEGASRVRQRHPAHAAARIRRLMRQVPRACGGRGLVGALRAALVCGAGGRDCAARLVAGPQCGPVLPHLDLEPRVTRPARMTGRLQQAAAPPAHHPGGLRLGGRRNAHRRRPRPDRHSPRPYTKRNLAEWTRPAPEHGNTPSPQRPSEIGDGAARGTGGRQPGAGDEKDPHSGHAREGAAGARELVICAVDSCLGTRGHRGLDLPVHRCQRPLPPSGAEGCGAPRRAQRHRPRCAGA